MLLEMDELSDEDESIKDELQNSVEELKKRIEDVEIKIFLSDKHDISNAIVTIHSGAGGTEACDWVSMLFRMYSMWAEKKQFYFRDYGYTSW